MLAELRIENLAVIEAAEMIFSPGLNVVTGETGAGKTILAHAISLLLGTRAGSGLIRPGSDEASVEAIFHLPEGFFADISEDFDIPEREDLIVRRRISRDGRSRAYLGGRATTLAVLEQATGRLLSFSAQHEQRRLMMASRQLDILDDYAGRELLDLRDEYRLLYQRRDGIKRQLDELSRDAEAREREMELLEFQVEEIDAAGLIAGEEEALAAERERLLRAGELRDSTVALTALLDGGGAGEGIKDSLSASLLRLEKVHGIDPRLDEISVRLRAGYFELEEIGREAREYGESVSVDPERLAEVEERLDLISALKRKYGSTVEEVIDFAVRASERLEVFRDSSQASPRLGKDLQEAESEMIQMALKMRELRAKAAVKLEAEAASHLEDLAFKQCGFEARMLPNEDEDQELTPDALTSAGGETVEFFVCPNPGLPAAPIRETASGGELSRIMLAVKSTVASAGDAATLVFDEIDAGIGGETGAAVGAKLKTIASGSQVICITHLPQIACHAEAHFSVVKDSGEGSTATTISRLAEDGVPAELCRMMGSDPGDGEALAHASSLLKKASAALKGTNRG